MAGDLIPPPSPAGRPTPDGGKPPAPAARERDDLRDRPAEPGSDDVVIAVRPDDGEQTWLRPPEPAATDDSGGGGTAIAAEQPPVVLPPRVRSRFGLLTGALIGVALAAMVVTIVTIASPDDPAPAAWSNWRPESQDAFTAAAEIAAHVGAEYRLNDGTQLVDVQSGPIALGDTALSVVVRTARPGGDIVPIRGNGLWYVLDGLGPGGSIDNPEPASAKRLALLKREALELTLYTFRYLPDIDHVVTILPPPPPDKKTTTSTGPTGPSGATSSSTATIDPDVPTGAMMFRPGDLRAQLDVPLALTLSPRTPRPQSLTERDAQLVTAFTAGNTFMASVLQGNQLGVPVLVLDRPRISTAPLLSATPSSGPTATATP